MVKCTETCWSSNHECLRNFYLSSWQRSDSPKPMLVIRLLEFAFALVILVCCLLDAPVDKMWIYFTTWSMLLILAMAGSGVAVSCCAFKHKLPEIGQPPWYVCMYWVFYNISISIAFLITLSYWRVISKDSSQVFCKCYFWLETTMFNSVLVFVEFFASRTPVRLGHVYQPLLLGVTYAIFTKIYQMCGGTNRDGRPYIYKFLDWSEPQFTLVYIMFSALGLILLYTILWGVAIIRDMLSKVCCSRPSETCKADAMEMMKPRWNSNNPNSPILLWTRHKRTLAGASVVSLLRTLRYCGFCRLPPAAGDPPPSLCARIARATHDAYCAFSLAVTTTYLVQELIYAYLERGDMDTLARVMFLLLCHVTSIAKQIVFMVRASRIEKLVQNLDDAAFNPEETTRKQLLMERAKGATQLGVAYAGTAALTCCLWTIFPLLVRLGGSRVVFALYIPFAYYSWPEFLIILMYTHYVTSLVGIANTTMDAFIAVILGQCKTQLTILKMDFESLAERASIRASETGEQVSTVASVLLVRCIKHHHKICDTSQELQAIFGSVVLLQFGIGGWILCMAAYKIVGLNIASLEFVSMVMFLMCILTELFLYCYYGNEVAVESAEVSDAVYGMQWVGPDGVGRDVRRTLPFVICCSAGAARRPLRPAALFIPLSLETFVTIIKSSYTFYAMLRQTQH